jgi:hypothetical protein
MNIVFLDTGAVSCLPRFCLFFIVRQLVLCLRQSRCLNVWWLSWRIGLSLVRVILGAATATARRVVYDKQDIYIYIYIYIYIDMSTRRGKHKKWSSRWPTEERLYPFMMTFSKMPWRESIYIYMILSCRFRACVCIENYITINITIYIYIYLKTLRLYAWWRSSSVTVCRSNVRRQTKFWIHLAR